MNTVCHIEIQSTDLDRSQAFYESLFGWTFRSFIPGMRIFGIGETHIGGLMESDTVQPGRSPSVWIQVENVDAVLAKVPGIGGAVVSEKSEVPSVGFSAELSDPDGSIIGIVQYTS